MKSSLKDFFNISATEQRGIMILIFLIVFVQTLRFVFPLVAGDQHEMTDAEAEALIMMEIKEKQKVSPASDQIKSNPEILAGKCFLFNPNSMRIEDWQRLGFSKKQAESAIKYTERGGRFLCKKDLKKLFFISENDYTRLERWIQLPDEITENSNQVSKNLSSISKKATAKFPVELNTADSTRLMDIRGVGPYWAGRIIRQRKRMGGFYLTNQLLEMKGFSDSIFQQIKPFVIADSTKIIKILINTVSRDTLQKHPYCWYGVGNSIVNFRTKHGPFRGPADLRKILSLKPAQLEKLLPYLSFE